MREVLKTASDILGCRISRIDVGLRCDDLGEWVSCVTQWKPGADLEDHQELKTTLSEARKGRGDVLCDLYCYSTSHGDDELESNLTLRLADWTLTEENYCKLWADGGFPPPVEMVGDIGVDFGTARTVPADIVEVITDGEEVTTRFVAPVEDKPVHGKSYSLTAADGPSIAAGNSWAESVVDPAEQIIDEDHHPRQSVIDAATEAVREGNANTTPAELGASLLSAHARGDHVRKSAKRSAELTTEQIKLGLSVFGTRENNNA